jgi:hypothetical protein
VKGEEYAWPREGRILFVDEGCSRDVAHFGWGSLSIQLAGYATGYKSAADTLVNEAVAQEDIAYRDTVVFPVLFLYRQYIELSLKAIILNLARPEHEIEERVIDVVGHDLMKCWDRAKRIVSDHASDRDVECVAVVGEYIRQFHEIDESSFNFRYPMGRANNQLFDSAQFINLRELGVAMQELANFLDGAYGHAQALKDSTEDTETDNGGT